MASNRLLELGFTKYLEITGFVPSKVDASLFIKVSGALIMYVLVYVDDIIVTENQSVEVGVFVKSLDQQFSLKDLGKLHYFSSTSLFLNQRKYIKDLLKKCNIEPSKASSTPMVSTCNLSVPCGSPIDNDFDYRSIAGALQYIVITWPDIAFTVNKVCQFMHKPLD
ncbi:uncharacterized mitochondrial protein AtMg00810-like [Gossypium arboreum]|uniref:uncharacterized mitochondrial protein AtMg00810-like n=1 Tax=Gossypium arboreum TaxID=29729 RepID=UPI0008193442|nr:uncharacterized mitochondrial protein AtMg00810-like [Gossypium arboreum]